MPEALDVRIGGNGRIVAIAPELPDGDAQICVLERTLLGNSLPLRTFGCAVNPREVFAVEIEKSAEPKPAVDA